MCLHLQQQKGFRGAGGEFDRREAGVLEGRATAGVVLRMATGARDTEFRIFDLLGVGRFGGRQVVRRSLSGTLAAAFHVAAGGQGHDCSEYLSDGFYAVAVGDDLRRFKR